jgi:hypothetical protein
MKKKPNCTDSGNRVKAAQVAAAAKKMKAAPKAYAKQLKKEETGMY